ncbi:DUF3043 domain-containing protein [Actinotalea sp.]|uniref:DUF3043 domain-containing protein n=1 Tax=Actinotalea sp. TaxID=1872145 RepID=UPI00356B4F10
MFSRNASTPPPADDESAPHGKGHATPSRKQAEAARRRPLVPSDRKEAVRAQRNASREMRQREQLALQTGEERYLPPRDKGPARRFTRDVVDARWSLGEFFLPVAFIAIIGMFLSQSSTEIAFIVLVVLYLIVFATIIDGFILSRQLRKRLEAKFEAAQIPRGTLMYGVTRAFQMRRLRLPKPQVGRGEYPS